MSPPPCLAAGPRPARTVPPFAVLSSPPAARGKRRVRTFRPPATQHFAFPLRPGVGSLERWLDLNA